MNVWRAVIHDADHAQVQVWAGSKREVRRLALQYNGGERDGIADIEKVNIPTDRKGLIWWLNLYFGTDNG